MGALTRPIFQMLGSVYPQQCHTGSRCPSKHISKLGKHRHCRGLALGTDRPLRLWVLQKDSPGILSHRSTPHMQLYLLLVSPALLELSQAVP